MEKLTALVLAAGEGKRMRSDLPKVIHPLCGRPMLSYILESAAELTKDIVIVVGHGASRVREAVGENRRYVLQKRQLGTGHAVMQALAALPAAGTLLVLCGDTPLLQAAHLRDLVASQRDKAAAVATAEPPDPSGYGRIVRGAEGLVERIVEEGDADARQKEIREINTGTYCFDLGLLRQYLPGLDRENVQEEYYLTDVVALLNRDGYRVGAFPVGDYRTGLGINNRAQLAEAEALIRNRINRALMLRGVTFTDPHSAYIDHDVIIGPDTLIKPGSVLEKGTVIGSGCRIGPNVYLKGAVVEDGASIEYAVIEGSTVSKGSQVGPFAHLGSNTCSGS